MHSPFGRKRLYEDSIPASRTTRLPGSVRKGLASSVTGPPPSPAVVQSTTPASSPAEVRRWQPIDANVENRPAARNRNPATHPGAVDPRHEECVGECDIRATGVAISYRSAAHTTSALSGSSTCDSRKVESLRYGSAFSTPRPKSGGWTMTASAARSAPVATSAAPADLQPLGRNRRSRDAGRTACPPRATRWRPPSE